MFNPLSNMMSLLLIAFAFLTNSATITFAQEENSNTINNEHSNRLLLQSDEGTQMINLLQKRRLQLEDLPDICAGFELIIDEIPEGRDSCECEGTAVHCLFRAVCPEGHTMDEERCADTVLYEIAFEDQGLTILSCAAVSEGNFEETCAKVSLAPDLQLDECLLGSYGGKPCDCEVCADRGSLLLDCSAYDKRAKTDCQSLGLGQWTPIGHGFNTTASEEDGVVDTRTENSTATAASGATAQTSTVTAISFSVIVVATIVSLL